MPKNTDKARNSAKHADPGLYQPRILHGMQEKTILRPVEILIGFKAIGAALGYGVDTVRKWEGKGAPIVRDARGIPRADKAELWEWYKQKVCQPTPKHDLDPT